MHRLIAKSLAIATFTLWSPLAALAAPNEVDIANFTFSPMSLTIPAGATVTWVNRDDIPHAVRSADDPPLFKSAPLDTDEHYTVTFAKPGTYHYICSIHPKMMGEIIVK
jgi:plastocyanin